MSASVTVSQIDFHMQMRHTEAMDGLYKEFGKKFRKARSEADLTQAQVAKRVGLSRTSITNIERGTQHIAMHQLFLLASAVGSEPADLLPDYVLALEELLSPDAIEVLANDSEGRDFAVRILSKSAGVRAAREEAPAKK
jgi:transcriptional regulator with XRE-family HTH domain